MLLFNKIRNKGIVENDKQLKIICEFQAFKQRIALYLQQKSELLSLQTKRYSLILFCLLLGGSSVAIAIHSATITEHAVSITNISKPLHSIERNNFYQHADSAITKQEYERVNQFKNYLLKIKTDSSTKRKYDSIIQARPQLTDSINLFEKMYLQQK